MFNADQQNRATKELRMALALPEEASAQTQRFNLLLAPLWFICVCLAFLKLLLWWSVLEKQLHSLPHFKPASEANRATLKRFLSGLAELIVFARVFHYCVCACLPFAVPVCLF